MLWLVLVLAGTASGCSQPDTTALAQVEPETCGGDTRAASGMADADLYASSFCRRATSNVPQAARALLPPSSPFGIAVTPAGEHQYDVLFDLRDLPDPPALGPYTAYVAWATTPQLDPVVKLGAVRNGTDSSWGGSLSIAS